MKFTCDRKQLEQAFALAAGVAPTRSPRAILTNVLLVAGNGAIALQATDGELSIVVNAGSANIESEGRVLLPVARTATLLRETVESNLSIEDDGSAVVIRAGRSRFRLPIAAVDEFPGQVDFSGNGYHEIPTTLVRECLHRVGFATDVESSRFALGGVLFELDQDGAVQAIATDGRRLATQAGSGKSVGGHATNGQAIVPARTVGILGRALAQVKDETVKVAASTKAVEFGCAQWTIRSQLVEGRYPNWRQVIPRFKESVRINLTVGPFHSALRQAAVVSDQESRGIDFRFGNGTLRMEANTASVGESHIEVAIPYEGEEIAATVDHRYVGEFCRALQVETEFTLELEAGDRPMMFSTEDGYRYVVMPMARDR